ncbi:hypothetical protein POTOM_015578 [Populus tomentosa]|uniref:Uncharacterized protein n=1 Tax=Populus tomentosa TaxID=118781 RepID=A0A8X8A249_POPTO|nr:hypothetical protein POTOM_015578 [Populus tomentosa]
MKALVIAILIATIAFSPLSMAARELVDYGIVSVSSSDYGTHKIDEKLHTLLSKAGLSNHHRCGVRIGPLLDYHAS